MKVITSEEIPDGNGTEYTGLLGLTFTCAIEVFIRDGKSYKTKQLIEIARAKGIPVKVVKF